MEAIQSGNDVDPSGQGCSKFCLMVKPAPTVDHNDQNSSFNDADCEHDSSMSRAGDDDNQRSSCADREISRKNSLLIDKNANVQHLSLNGGSNDAENRALSELNLSQNLSFSGAEIIVQNSFSGSEVGGVEVILQNVSNNDADGLEMENSTEADRMDHDKDNNQDDVSVIRPEDFVDLSSNGPSNGIDGLPIKKSVKMDHSYCEGELVTTESHDFILLDDDEDETSPCHSLSLDEYVLLMKLEQVFDNNAQKPFKCSLCDQRFLFRSVRSAHKRTHSSEVTEKVLKCDLCDERFTNARSLNSHVSSRHYGDYLRCSMCPCRFKTQKSLTEHEKKWRNGRPFRCVKCCSGFMSQERLDQHTAVSHSDRRVTCDVCGVQVRPRCMTTHKKRHTRTGKTTPKFICALCGESCVSEHSLKRHIGKHTGEKPCKCPQCGKCFDFPSDLKFHMMQHSSEKLYLCPICGKRMKTSSLLDKHMRCHSGEKPLPYLCAYCGKTFTTEAGLKRHTYSAHRQAEQKIGSAYGKKYSYTKVCPYCRKSFPSAGYRTHIRTHTGEKPYGCHICPRAFRQRAHLDRHLAYHAGEKPFQCPHCLKRCSTKSDLKQHVRTHTGEKPFMCPVCGASFRDQSARKKHVVRYHPETIDKKEAEVLLPVTNLETPAPEVPEQQN